MAEMRTGEKHAAPSAPKKSKKKVFIILGLLLVLVVGGTIAYFPIRTSMHKKDAIKTVSEVKASNYMEEDQLQLEETKTKYKNKIKKEDSIKAIDKDVKSYKAAVKKITTKKTLIKGSKEEIASVVKQIDTDADQEKANEYVKSRDDDFNAVKSRKELEALKNEIIKKLQADYKTKAQVQEGIIDSEFVGTWQLSKEQLENKMLSDYGGLQLKKDGTCGMITKDHTGSSYFAVGTWKVSGNTVTFTLTNDGTRTATYNPTDKSMTISFTSNAGIPSGMYYRQ